MNLEEKVSSVRLAKRREAERLKAGEEQQEKEQPKIDIEVIKKGIQEGKAVIKGTTFLFEERELLNKKITMPIVKGFFKELANAKENFAYMNEPQGISLQGAYTKEMTIQQNFEQFKKGMEEQFKQMELYLEWEEEGTISAEIGEIPYGWFMTPTGAGKTKNLIFYFSFDGGTVIGNYNCFEKDYETWKPIIEASLQLMR